MHTAAMRRSVTVTASILPLCWLISAAASPPASQRSGAEPLDAFASQNSTLSEDRLEASYQRGPRGGQAGRVYKDRITPYWFQNNSRFWYRNDLRGGGREFLLVDAERGTRAAAFDHEKLAESLSKAAGAEYQAMRLPFDDIEFVEDGKAVQFKVGEVRWQCELTTYECSKAEPKEAASPQPGQGQRGPGSFGQRRFPGDGTRADSARSPDDKWTAFVRDHNVFMRTKDGEIETKLSEDGTAEFAYGMLRWAPDSQTLVAFRIAQGERKEVYLIESSPRGGGRAKLQTRPYALPGDKFTTYELKLFRVGQTQASKAEDQTKDKPGDAKREEPNTPAQTVATNRTTGLEIKPELDPIDFGSPRLRWNRDGHTFTYTKIDRGHQRLRVIEVDTHTGLTRNIIDEKTETFLWTAHTENVTLRTENWLDQTDEMIYASERDGWRHLYLIDTRAGQVKNQITTGEWVVRGIERIDEDHRQIWFRASGRIAGQDPYFIHFYRVNFDGTGLVALTEGHGTHSIQFSPDRRFLIDTYSRVDLAPVHELRRVADGKLVCELEQSDISELLERGWTPPEVFVARGRDGQTDIWGVIARPHDLDPTKKYPVIESIYAGPQGSFVPKSFSAASRFESLTALGFIVVQMDGMGTANRSKAFHDVCWKNLKDAGLPDRILWHQAAAGKYPYYDLSRVGIYGTSAGGQNAMSAVLFHPEFYKAAVSACGCHDNRLDKASWNEQWMGYPVGPQYAECSNVDNAHRLRGKLLLIVGEMDTNVPPESTFRVVDALIKADKDFDFVVVPGAGHGMGGAYGQRRMQDFFVRHLRGTEPPNRNAPSVERASE